MFQNDKEVVKVLTYSGQTDSYGQKRQDTPSARYTEMYIKQYSASNTNDIRYADIAYTGLTKDQSLTDAECIEYKGTIYTIKYIVPSGRLTQVFLKKAG